MAPNRPAIPRDIQLKVRQECGFGCVICGRPFYDYDHIDEWSEGGEHTAENLALLCISHHGDKSRGRLDREIVRRSRLKPHNIARKTTEKYELFTVGDEMKFDIGSNKFSAVGLEDGQRSIVLQIRGHDVFSVRRVGDQLLVSISIYDENGDIILKVEDNNLLIGLQVWDVNVVSDRYTFKYKNNSKYDMEIRINGREVVVKRALFLAVCLAHDPPTVERVVNIFPTHVVVTDGLGRSNTLANTKFEGSGNGMRID